MVLDFNDIFGFVIVKIDYMNIIFYKYLIYFIGRVCINFKELNIVNCLMGVKSVYVFGLCLVGKVNYWYLKLEY